MTFVMVKILFQHDNISFPCKSVKKLGDFSDILNNKLTDEFMSASIILINEAQFLKILLNG